MVRPPFELRMMPPIQTVLPPTDRHVTSMLKAYIALRDRKVDEYGLTNDGELLSGSVNVYRTDSEQTEEPTYESDGEDWF